MPETKRLPKDVKEKLKDIIEELEKEEAGEESERGEIELKIDRTRPLWYVAYST